MKGILIIIAAALALTGCGSMNKHREIHTKAAAIHSDSAARTVTITREKADTTVKVPAVKQTATKPVTNLVAGDSIVLDNDRQHVTVDYDPLTGSIRATGTVKEIQVPVTIDREVIKSEEVAVSHDQVKTQDDIVQSKDVRTSSGFMYGVIVSVFLVAIILLAIVMIAFKLRF